jgi:hypothetical protein
MASPSAPVTGPVRVRARLCGISRVGSIPAVKMAAINSRSANSDLPLLYQSVNADWIPPLPSSGLRQNNGRNHLPTPRAPESLPL